MISAKFLCGNVLLGGKLQIGAKNSNFEIFESALYMKSVSMPLRFLNYKYKGGMKYNQGSFKGESLVVAILPSHMKGSYCTSRFFHSR